MLNIIKEVYQNYFEITSAITAAIVIIVAYFLDKAFFLQACAMCILTRYIFGLVLLSSISTYFFKNKIGYVLIAISSVIGIFVTSKQIYIQNLALEKLAQLSGCGMPFHTMVDYFGIVEAISRTLQGGPSCAEDGMRFIFNFAEWAFIFFLVYLILSITKLLKS